jgi:hypothetical protein
VAFCLVSLCDICETSAFGLKPELAGVRWSQSMEVGVGVQMEGVQMEDLHATQAAALVETQPPYDFAPANLSRRTEICA